MRLLITESVLVSCPDILKEKNISIGEKRDSHLLLESKASLYALYISGPFAIIIVLVIVLFYKRMKREQDCRNKMIVKRKRKKCESVV